MTERLYYPDPYCRSFDAQIVRVFEHDGRPAVALDRTGGSVRGELDWSRRFDHMQQHPGQHLVFARKIEIFDFPCN